MSCTSRYLQTLAVYRNQYYDAITQSKEKSANLRGAYVM